MIELSNMIHLKVTRESTNDKNFTVISTSKLRGNEMEEVVIELCFIDDYDISSRVFGMKKEKQKN